MSATQPYASSHPAHMPASDDIGMDGNLSTGTDVFEHQATPAFHYNAIDQDYHTPTINDREYLQSSIQYSGSSFIDFQTPYDPRLAPLHPVIHVQQDSNYSLVTQDYRAIPNDIVDSYEDGLPATCENLSRQGVGHVGYSHHSQRPFSNQSSSSGYSTQLSSFPVVPGAYVATPVGTKASFEFIQFDPAKPKCPRNRTPISSESFKKKPEFGLIQMMITESDLRVIRKHYDYIPRSVYRKHDLNTEQSVRITERELENLRIHMQRKGIKVKTTRRKRDFMEAVPAASARYEKFMAKQVAKVTGRDTDDVLAEIRAHTI